MNIDLYIFIIDLRLAASLISISAINSVSLIELMVNGNWGGGGGVDATADVIVIKSTAAPTPPPAADLISDKSLLLTDGDYDRRLR